MKKNKVVIHCASGLGNIGDEALLMSFIAKYWENYDIIVLCADKSIARQYTGYKKCLNDTDSRCKKAIRDCDIFVLGGGGLFQDETSIYNVYRWGRHLSYAKKLGKKTFVYANSVGPLKYVWSRRYVAGVLEDVDAITLRDKESLELLKKINITNAQVTADGVFGLQSVESKVSKSNISESKLSENKITDESAKPYVCVVVRHWFDCIPFIPVSICKKLGIQSKKNRIEYEKFIDSIVRIIDAINKDYDYDVVLLPFMKDRDFKVSQDIISRLQNKERNQIVPEEDFGVYNYFSIIKNARLVIGMRLHSIIFAIMSATPFIALNYSKKVGALLEYLGFGELKTDVTNLHCRDVTDLIEYVERHRDEIISNEVTAAKKMKVLEAVNDELFLIVQGLSDPEIDYDKKNSEKIEVLYSSDEGYVPIAGVSIISLLENNKEISEIAIHYIDCGLSEQSRKVLRKIALKYKREIIFYPLEEVLSYYTINAPKPSYYGRLLAPFFIKSDKVLYLDCDLLVVDSLKTLWDTDVKDYSMAAVQGPGISAQNRAKLNIPADTRYINSGMLLINLDYWRKHQTAEKLIDYLNKNGEIPPYHDQNIINAICCSDTLIIHPRYNLLWSMMCCKPKDICKLNKIPNYYTDEEINSAINNPVIIHFSNSIYGRPWKKGCHHKYRKAYMYYRRLSPWKNEPLTDNNLSKFRKLRNAVYRVLPSRAYYLAQATERWIVENCILRLPDNRLSNWVKTYMNGK